MISPERCFAPSAPPPPATHSTDLDGDLAAVTCYFNPCGYRLRREHYDRFAENLDRQGVPLYTIELTIRDQPAALGHYPNVRVLRSDHVLWHKERLLNLLIRSLPSRFDKVAWIDADVLLQDPDWPARVQEVLRRVPIAQLFTELLLLDRDGHPFSKRLGVASAAKRGHPSSHNLGHFHPGMAWAARRQLIDRHGLLDNHVLGGADSIMVCSMFGWWDHSLVRVYHPPLQQAMLRWGEILIFLDGHCHVDADSLRRLVDDVRRVGDSAIITPIGLRWPRLQSDAELPPAFPEPEFQTLLTSPSPPPDRRIVLLLGYWPPTDIGIDARHGMLWKWKTLQENYKNSGYDVLAISPTFNSQLGWSDVPKTIPYWGKGEGQLTVDYRTTSKDFWEITQERLPVAIMSFSRGSNDKSWEIESAARNLSQDDWIKELEYLDNNDIIQEQTWEPPYAGGSVADFSPDKGHGTVHGNPPHPIKSAGAIRGSNLPMKPIRDSVNAEFPNPPGDVVAAIDSSGDVGSFVSEYMAYHVAWYRNYINAKYPDDPAKQCQRSGHVHVGISVAVPDAEEAVDIQPTELFNVLT